MSFVKIIDLINGGILFYMNCKDEVFIIENKDMQTRALRPQPISNYKNFYSLSENTMKKLLKKIK
ncbi:hypothetical protein MPF19_12525 [Polaribacter sp. Z014]|uniref:hypothetical protein n=1 Tax=Polaribacter sp. Z014 TaxID=2927126 RepID=UPI0020202B0B|nr:hypothetical protein [Polaribacter sp. Z014]MCL7764244.1 hypothetical protein [Polaribacter sp. Z014]